MQTTTLGLTPSFGFGDRTGLATPGHIAAMRSTGTSIAPIFAQQSIREMSRTSRTPAQVMADAARAVDASGYCNETGADADHLKTEADIESTVSAGFTFFTLDPSGDVDADADSDSNAVLMEKVVQLGESVRWMDRFIGTRVKLAGNTSIELDEMSCRRAAVKYGRAIDTACRLADCVSRTARAANRPYEIELSIDETPHPTSLAEHWLIASRCREKGVMLISLAPRFVGEFEKGIDFKGNREAFVTSLVDHARIADELGPYKLSLHSGSDKLSIYGPLARATQGRFHVKTAGTSYLEALRVAAREDASLFREILIASRLRYSMDKLTYHVSATLDSAPDPTETTDMGILEAEYLGNWSKVPAGEGFTQPGRQILHVTFGSVLCDPVIGSRLRICLESHPETYREVLTDHFSRHLHALA